jgi:hypothetical protein
MAEEEMDVRFVGGPHDWAGKTLRMPVGDDEPGAYLISMCTPDRDEETEDIDPRAVYTPDEPPADQSVWHFRGWFPPALGDPPPEDYLSGSVPDPRD